MKIYTDFEDDIVWVKQQILGEISSYPALLRKAGISYLRNVHLLPEDPLPAGITTYLPLWVKDAFDFQEKDAICNTLTLGYIYIVLFELLEDSVLDRDEKSDSHLLLSYAFLTRFLRLHRSLFSQESKFWDLFEKYMKELFQFKLWEMRARMNYRWKKALSDSYFRLLRKGSAFMKPTLSALAILGHEERQIKHLSQMIEHYFIGIKLVDDFIDWKDDLQNRRYTSFLTLALDWLSEKKLDSIGEQDVTRFIFASDSIELIYDKSILNVKLALKSIRPLGCPYLVTYLNSVTMDLKRQKRDILNNRERLVTEKIIKPLWTQFSGLT